MTLLDDFPTEMERLPLDLDTADRLLAGSIAPSDAPPGYARVACVLAALEPSAGERLTCERETIALLAETVRTSRAPRTKTSRRSIVPRIKLASALVAAALAGTAGLALAGNLPGAAQDIASSMLAKLGVSVPRPDGHAGTHATVRGSVSEQVRGEGHGPASTGAAISELATTTELTGVAKGAAISTLASGGTSGAGENGAAGETHGAPVEAPNEGGTGTANAASGGASSIGTSEADTASAGHSAAGAGNAAAGASHRP